MNLNSITTTYPGFQSLPKGVKQMLLVSESVFFEETRTASKANQSSHLSHLHSDIIHVASQAAYGFEPRAPAHAG